MKEEDEQKKEEAAAEAARLKADEETRAVYVPVENPDGLFKWEEPFYLRLKKHND